MPAVADLVEIVSYSSLPSLFGVAPASLEPSLLVPWLLELLLPFRPLFLPLLEGVVSSDALELLRLLPLPDADSSLVAVLLVPALGECERRGEDAGVMVERAFGDCSADGLPWARGDEPAVAAGDAVVAGDAVAAGEAVVAGELVAAGVIVPEAAAVAAGDAVVAAPGEAAVLAEVL